MSTQAQHHLQQKTSERQQLSKVSNKDIRQQQERRRKRKRRPRSKQQRPTSRIVDTTQQSVDDEASSKIHEMDVKQVKKTTEYKRRQSATTK